MPSLPVLQTLRDLHLHLHCFHLPAPPLPAMAWRALSPEGRFLPFQGNQAMENESNPRCFSETMVLLFPCNAGKRRGNHGFGWCFICYQVWPRINPIGFLIIAASNWKVCNVQQLLCLHMKLSTAIRGSFQALPSSLFSWCLLLLSCCDFSFCSSFWTPYLYLLSQLHGRAFSIFLGHRLQYGATSKRHIEEKGSQIRELLIQLLNLGWVKQP